MPAASFWTEEHFAILKEIHALGSNAWIASEINRRTGSSFTRNAIIGKRHREGLPSPVSQGRCSGNQVKRKPRVRRRVYWDKSTRMKKPLPPQPTPPDFLGLTIWEVNETTCRYPKGDGTEESPYLFCGNPVIEGSSFCAYCHSICWRPTKVRPISPNSKIWGYAA